MEKDLLQRVKENINRVIIGKEKVIELLMTALLSQGHVLIDDVPGTGKTKLANSLARTIAADFKRIQFTPDLQPADITGIYFYNQKMGDFTFRPGPLLSNIVLADEINRAVPRTQSSLLEAMEEKQVTVEGEIYKLDEPFMVIATQNPIELEGTFPLPEAQLDRFLLKIKMGYPDRDDEVAIMRRFQTSDPILELEPVIDPEEIAFLRKETKNVNVSDVLLTYIADLCAVSREHENIKLGLSPRASLAIMKASQAYAYIKERDYVLPDDIKYLFPYIAEHRLILNYDSNINGVSKKEIMEDIIRKVEVPVEGVIDE